MPGGFAVFIVLFIVLVIVGAVFAHRAAKKRQAALVLWATTNGFSLDMGQDHALESRFPLHKCLREGSESLRRERDGGGAWRPRHLRLRLPLRDPLDELEGAAPDAPPQLLGRGRRHGPARCKPLIIRPENFLDKIAEFVGFDDIDFELTEFSSKFYVKAPDRKWAYEVLHQATMEFLLESPRFTLEMAGPWVHGPAERAIRRRASSRPPWASRRVSWTACRGISCGELKGEDA